MPLTHKLTCTIKQKSFIFKKKIIDIFTEHFVRGHFVREFMVNNQYDIVYNDFSRVKYTNYHNIYFIDNRNIV